MRVIDSRGRHWCKYTQIILSMASFGYICCFCFGFSATDRLRACAFIHYGRTDVPSTNRRENDPPGDRRIAVAPPGESSRSPARNQIIRYLSSVSPRPHEGIQPRYGYDSAETVGCPFFETRDGDRSSPSAIWANLTLTRAEYTLVPAQLWSRSTFLYETGSRMATLLNFNRQAEWILIVCPGD